MKDDIKIYTAGAEDAQIIKDLINEMYGIEYEQRDCETIGKIVEKCEQVYVLVYQNDKVIGFAGATINSDEYVEFCNQTNTVIEYVYVKEKNRDFLVAYELMKKLLEELIQLGRTKAIMQVQTFNKERFLHYALSDKNIINSFAAKRNEVEYEEQILLINDINECLKLSMRDYMKKTLLYAKQDNGLKINKEL